MLCTLIGAIILSINILNIHLYDYIGDASSSLRGSTSSHSYALYISQIIEFLVINSPKDFFLYDNTSKMEQLHLISFWHLVPKLAANSILALSCSSAHNKFLIAALFKQLLLTSPCSSNYIHIC